MGTLDYQVGKVLEAAAWFNSEHASERTAAITLVTKAMERAVSDHAILISKVEFSELSPGDDRAPQPPKEFAGTPKLMMANATVVAIRPSFHSDQSYFTEDLDPKDLEKLRRITQGAYVRANPGHGLLSDAELDKVINDIGPETALKSLRHGTNERTLN